VIEASIAASGTGGGIVLRTRTCPAALCPPTRTGLRGGRGLARRAPSPNHLFAVYAFLAAGSEATYAFGSNAAGPVAWHLLLALLDVAA
jgi:hypothetical protein